MVTMYFYCGCGLTFNFILSFITFTKSSSVEMRIACWKTAIVSCFLELPVAQITT